MRCVRALLLPAPFDHGAAARSVAAARIFSSNVRVDAKDKGIIYLGVLSMSSVVVCAFWNFFWLMFRKVGAPDFRKKEKRKKKEKIGKSKEQHVCIATPLLLH